jgi:hypothetical protein
MPQNGCRAVKLEYRNGIIVVVDEVSAILSNLGIEAVAAEDGPRLAPPVSVRPK